MNDVKVENEADFLRAIDGNVVGDTIGMVVMRYIEDPRASGSYGSGIKEGSKRHAVETKMRLKLSK